MSSATKEIPSISRRLDSWKSIAQHMGRSCRTVQRWHDDYKLPIHRIGDCKGPIFAYTNELDEWLRDSGGDITNASAENGESAPAYSAIASREPAKFDEFFDLSLVPQSSRVRSAELTALGFRMWTTLAHGNLNMIARLFREALELDPNNANSFAGLGNALVAQGMLGILRGSAAYDAAQAALGRALQLDPGNAEAICTVAWAKMFAGRDWVGARLGLEKVVMRDPPVIRGIVGLGLLLIAEGRLFQACRLLGEVSRENVLNSIALGIYCWSEFLTGEYGRAIQQVEQCRASGQFGLLFDAVEALAAIQIEPPDAYIKRIEALSADSPHHNVLQGACGYAYAVNGQTEKAVKILEAMSNPRVTCQAGEPYAIALILIGLNEHAKAVRMLEQSYRDGSIWSLGFLSDPLLTPLRNHPDWLLFLNNSCYPISASVDSFVKFAN